MISIPSPSSVAVTAVKSLTQLEDDAIASVLASARLLNREGSRAPRLPQRALSTPSKEASSLFHAVSSVVPEAARIDARISETQELLENIRVVLDVESSSASAFSPPTEQLPPVPKEDANLDVSLVSQPSTAPSRSAWSPPSQRRPPPTREAYDALSRTFIAAHAARTGAIGDARSMNKESTSVSAGDVSAASSPPAAPTLTLPLCRVITLDREQAALAEMSSLASKSPPLQQSRRGHTSDAVGASPLSKWETSAAAAAAVAPVPPSEAARDGRSAVATIIPARLLGDVHYRAFLDAAEAALIPPSLRSEASALLAITRAAPQQLQQQQKQQQKQQPARADRAAMLAEELAAAAADAASSAAAASDTETSALIGGQATPMRRAPTTPQTTPARAPPPVPMLTLAIADQATRGLAGDGREEVGGAVADDVPAAAPQTLQTPAAASALGETRSDGVGGWSGVLSLASTPVAATSSSSTTAVRSAASAGRLRPQPTADVALLVALPQLTPTIVRALRREAEAASKAACSADDAVNDMSEAAASPAPSPGELLPLPTLATNGGAHGRRLTPPLLSP